MRATLRLKMILLAAGLGPLPTVTLAQNVPDAASNAPAQDTVGPKELQNFSLPGTATRPAETGPATGARPSNTAEPAPAATATPSSVPLRRSVAARPMAPPPTSTSALQSPPSLATASPPPVSVATSTVSQPTAPAPILPQPAPAADTAASAPEHKLSILPWLVLALALAAGTLFLLWRRRPREALAGPQFDLVAASKPQPAPPPSPRAPAPQPKAVQIPPSRERAAANGIVASRLRPSIEIGMQPLRCLIDDSQVTIEFEVELFNAGAAPARAVFAEARLLNASATQDQELAAFFSKPNGTGERMDAIGPMKRVTLTNRVVAPRAAVQEYELAGRKAFVPVIAFNALYEWSGGKGQSSLAYLVGRETRTEKLGPFRLDNGVQDVRRLGARPLPVGVRT